jgi:hypothetical protein
VVSTTDPYGRILGFLDRNGFHKMLRNPWAVEQLAVSQEGFFFMELASEKFGANEPGNGKR